MSWIFKRPNEYHARLEGRVSLRIDSALLIDANKDRLSSILVEATKSLTDKLQSEFPKLFIDEMPCSAETQELGMLIVHGTDFRHSKLKCFSK